MTFATAETRSLYEGSVTRQHSRIVATDRKSKIFNRPLVYIDDCTSFQGDKLYVYSRHGVDQKRFLSLVDSLLERRKSDFREIASKPFHCVLNIRDQLHEGELQAPFSQSLAEVCDQINFMRVYAAFGDISIDFSAEPIIRSNELMLQSQEFLSTNLEFPICAFEASESDVWVPLLTEIHWASGMMPRSILEVLIRDAARMKVRA